MQEGPEAEQVPSLNTIIPGQPEGWSPLPSLPLMKPFQGNTYPSSGQSSVAPAPSADCIITANQLWQQLSGLKF